MKVIKNVRFGKDRKSDGYVVVNDGIIETVGHGSCPECNDIIDGEGQILYAGLCDIHTHGAQLKDFTAADADKLVALEDWYSSAGSTSVFATTSTAELSKILQAVKNIKEASLKVTKTHYDGIHIEGPFLSFKRRGAHNSELLKNPDIKFMEEVLKEADGLKVRVTVAPELEGALDFIKACVSMGIYVTLGHSCCTYETALEAIKCGADCVTHTFNGMEPIHHREPGLITAALTEDIYAELICDGMHVAPGVVKLFSKLKNPGHRDVLITDSVQLAGCPEGAEVTGAGGMGSHVVNGKIVTKDRGVLSGSSLKLATAVANYSNFTNMHLDNAVAAATVHSATAVGLIGKIGTIENGKRADFIVMNDNGKLLHTIIEGKIVYNS